MNEDKHSHVYTEMCTHTHIHVYRHTHKASMHPHRYAYMYTCVSHMNKDIHINAYTLFADMHAYLHNYTHAYTGMHGCTETYNAPT